MKKHKGKILVLFLAVLLVSVMSCENPFLKKMLVEEEKGNTVPEKPQEPENPAVPVPKHTVSFSVEGAGGTLKARADGIAETDVSPITVEQGKTVTFTAEPAAGYVVKEWKVDGAVVTDNTSNTYTHTVTAAVNIKVSFETLPPGKVELTLSPDKLDIKVRVRTADGTPVTVEGCEETTLASSNSTYTELHAQGIVVILKGKITELYCDNNQLTALDVQDLTALQLLWCFQNQLTALNVQGLNNLQRLECVYNQLTTLDVQGCTALQRLVCWNNQLTALDVQGLTALQSLSCGGNQLTELNVSGCTALEKLSCSDNHLTALNVQDCTALKELWCYRNQLTALDVQGLNALQELHCYINQLTALDVQGCTALKELDCWNNQLTALNVQGLSALEKLYCSGNQLTALDVQGLTALQSLYCHGNQLTELNVSGCTALQWLYCRNNQLTALDVQGLTSLQMLYCPGNQLNAQAFIKIFTDLPQRDAGDNAKCCLYIEGPGVTEGNCTDFTTPSEVQAAFQNAKDVKNWRMCKVNTSLQEEEI
ncbi:MULTISPECIES: leucine-rich repeat domain-containing protein [Treponema]|uniref:leucine-rich repeat domain-containing protein n=1 Tax=Treponema TaxID=157 RepID=UPI0002B4F4C2|nr:MULTISPECIES: leucine-rich repeat domain-containing protein [Treponema]EMB47966.1 hypothetical protein HMPREF9729_00308 [Treponema denticola ASLM]EMD56202.1 hypothetical protein HMPREF9728_02075 [Treponema denticola US-Trep]UTD09496.1 leucine-rich repeat domain-containing protein [Treponema sp. B152]